MFSRHPDFHTPDAAVEARVQAILDRMTLEEKIACLGGSTQDKVDDGNTVPCPRVGLPSLRMADASVGVHWWTEDSTTFPASIALAASFDPELAYRYGAAIGRECRARGIHILLGPGVNLYRSALCGRNFEYLGEDPCLAGRLVAGYIRGLQDQGVAATVKHYACNFQEYSRHRVSTDVDERTLREVYLAAFEAAVKDGGAGAVMTAYNRVNGQWCAEHHHLLTDILKGAWGFDGLVMSDWVSVYDTVNTALAGLDLEMPRAQWLTLEKLLPLVKNGVVPEAVIADKVRRLLRLAVAFGWLDRPQRDATIPLHDETSAAVACEVAVAGTVLLKNDGVLPLDASRLRRIAVIGPGGHPAVIGGGGSAFNKPWRSVSIAEGIKAVFPQAEVLVEAGVDLWRHRKIFETSVFSTPEGEPGLRAEFFSNPDLGGRPCLVRTEPRCSGRLTPADLPAGLAPLNTSLRLRGVFQVPQAGEYAIPIEAWNGGLRVTLDGRVLIESWSAEVMGDRMHVLDLAAGAHELVVEFHGMRTRSFVMAGYEPTAVMRIGVPAALAAARSADLVIFCGGHTDKNEGEARDRDFAMHGEIERLLLAVLDANPNTVAVMTAGGNLDMRTWHDRVRALLWAWYPGQEGGTALARILAGLDEPGGRLPATFEHRPEDRSSHDCYHDHDGDLRVTLRDGVFGGYRHHDRNGVTPRYPFGFGLGYTRFAFRDLELRSADGGFPVEASFTVENTGRRRGSTVAQVYVGEQRPCLPRPVKELKGFSKVTLDPGESRRVSVALQRRDFCFWDSTAGDWRLHPGRFTIAVGASAAEIVLSGETTCGTTQEGMTGKTNRGEQQGIQSRPE